MNLNEVDAYALLNSDNSYYLKQVEDVVDNIEFSLRKVLDRGVVPSEFDSVNALYIAAQTAKELVSSFGA